MSESSPVRRQLALSCWLLLLVLLLAACCLAAPKAGDKKNTAVKKETVKKEPGPPLIDETTRWTKCRQAQNMSIYDYEVETLEGDYVDLDKYRGQILLVINVATFCAFTQQYLDFNGMIERNRANGNNLTILAFPSNQFHLQEPSENHEILNGVMHVRPGHGWKPHENLHFYGKIDVNGDKHHPLYEFMKDSCPQTVPRLGTKEEMFFNPIRVNDITWNFEKFLIDAEGRPRFRFHPTNWVHGKEVQKYIDYLAAEQKDTSSLSVEEFKAKMV